MSAQRLHSFQINYKLTLQEIIERAMPSLILNEPHSNFQGVMITPLVGLI